LCRLVIQRRLAPAGSRGGQIDTNIDNIDTNVGIGIDRYQRENIDT